MGLQATIELVLDFYRDGLIAAVAAGAAGGWVGTRLALHRIPLAGLAAPQLSALGVALAALLLPGAVVPGESSFVAALASLVCVLGGTAVVAVGSRRYGSVGALAGLLFVAGWSGSVLIAGVVPDPGLAEFLRAEGRVLTVSAGERNLVVAVAVVTMLVLGRWRRAFDAAAFDPDQAALIGLRPGRLSAIELGAAGVFVSLTVPVLGAMPILAMLFLPSALVVPGARRLATLGPLAASAATLGVLWSFWLAVAADWPLDSTMALSIGLVSAVVSLLVRLPSMSGRRGD